MAHVPSPRFDGETPVGRGDDLDRIHRLLHAGNGGGSLLLVGEAGVGKSLVLDSVAASVEAEGGLVLRAAGVEFEADVSYSGLNQVLFPLRDAFDSLDDAYRDALRVALGFGTGAPPERLVVSNAALVLLTAVAGDRPLLLAIDDLPWIDRASAVVLGFIARRLSGTRISFLAAMRFTSEGFFERGHLPEYVLPPLGRDTAAQLVSARFPGLVGANRERILDSAEGNPLALLELPAALSGAQRAAAEELPEVLPLTQRLQALFGSRLAELPPPTQRLLLLATLIGSGDLGLLQAAARRLPGGADLDDLAAAERAQLVRVDQASHHLGFRHPLICSALFEQSTSSQRRAAHRAAAEVLADQPERRAWHLSEATLEPDEQVAGLLEEAARRILRRGDAVGAVRAMTRAGELSPSAPTRSRRLAEAAYIGAEVAGALDRASELLEGARRADPQLTGSLHSAAAAAQLILNRDGDVATAHRLLAAAVESGAHGYDAADEALIEALYLLALLAHYSGLPEFWTPVTAAIARLEPTAPPLLSALCKTVGDPARLGRSGLAELQPHLAEMADETDPGRVTRTGTACLYVDRLGDLREPSWRVVRLGRDGGSVRRYIGGLFHLGMDDYVNGKWDEAVQLADEGAALCETYGYAFFSWYFWAVQAMIAGVRGEEERCRELTERITRWAAPRGVRVAGCYAHHARTLAALGRADFEAAYRYASTISPAGTLAPRVPHALWLAMDLVEAAVHTGRHDEATSHVAAIDASDMAELSPRFALLAAGAAAMCAPDDDEAVRLFEKALVIPGADRCVFELARVRLAYGERLRRNRSRAGAREPLRDALATFEELGARPWAERAAKELRATGIDVPRHGGPAAGRMLTPQELEIAELAASGLTNKEIAQRLHISHRTVGAHLYQLYPKLGVTSRAMLREALESLSDS